MSFALNPKPHDSGRLAMWLQPSLSQRFGVFNRHWKIHWHCGESKVAVTSVESNLKGSKWRSGAAIAEMGQDSLFVESLVTATQNAFKWLLHMFALPFYFGSWHVLTTIWSQVLAARNLRSQSHSPGFWRGLAASIAIFRAFLSLLHVYHNNIQVLSFFMISDDLRFSKSQGMYQIGEYRSCRRSRRSHCESVRVYESNMRKQRLQVRRKTSQNIDPYDPCIIQLLSI